MTIASANPINIRDNPDARVRSSPLSYCWKITAVKVSYRKIETAPKSLRV